MTRPDRRQRGMANVGHPTRPARPWPDRLALADRIIDQRERLGPTVAVAVVDQLDAATRDADLLLDTLSHVLATIEPGRNWAKTEVVAGRDQERFVLAAVLDVRPCIHLRRGGPQPSVVNLATGRADCQLCARTVRHPPADNADGCDVCGQSGVATFTPVALRYGAAIVLVDACQHCAVVLVPRRRHDAGAGTA